MGQPALPWYPAFIAGEERAGTERMVVCSPYDGHAVAEVAVAGPADMEDAIAAAASAFETCRALPRHERQAILRRIADALRENLDRMANLMVADSGKPLSYAQVEVRRAIATFSLAGDEVSRSGGEMLPLDITPAGVGYTVLATRRAIGTIGAISPFNFPLNLAAHKIAPAIAIGNPVVLKVPPQAPLCALELARIIYAAGWPKCGFSAMHAPVEVAQHLATDERIAMLSFTGSSAVGWHLRGIAGRKRVVLELGGNAAAIVCSDADVDWAAQRCALGAFAQAGQVCIKVQRIYVVRERYDAFVAAFLRETRALVVGDPSDAKTVVGPVIDDRSRERIASWVSQALEGGATLLYGNTWSGSVLTPTILEHTSESMRVECEEIFGPVVTLCAVDTLDEALERANATRFGLQAGIFTHDARTIAAAFERLDVGGVVANDYPTFRTDSMPYGGVKESGSGREGVRYAMDEMSELKSLVVRYR